MALSDIDLLIAICQAICNAFSSDLFKVGDEMDSARVTPEEKGKNMSKYGDWMRSPRPEVIRELRELAGWSREKVARQLRVTHSTVWRWEQGKGRMQESLFELMLLKIEKESGQSFDFDEWIEK